MADRQALYAALQKADAAGDVAAARQLAAYIQTLPPDAAPDKPAAAQAPDIGSRARAQQTSDGILTKALANVVPGLVRGAGSIGATLMAPYDIAKDAIDGKGLSLQSNRERRAGIDAGLQEMGADANDPGYKLGKFAGEVAGTAGAGGAVANGVGRLAPGLAAQAPNLLNAIRTAGMVAGKPAPGIAGAATNAITRAAGGAINGAVSAGMVDPSQAPAGAVVGGLVPPAMQLGGVAAKAGGNAIRSLLESGDVTGARELAKALDLSGPDLAAALQKLRSAETLVPGSAPTVAQALQTPQASILQRVVHDSAGGEQLRSKIVQQSQARTNALEAVAPTNVEGVRQAQHDFGTSVQNQMLPEQERLAAQVRSLYEGVDPQGQVRVGLPVNEFEQSVGRYLGPGSFGQGRAAEQALNEAKAVTPMVAAPNARGGAVTTVPGPVGWQDVSRLRSSINDAWQAAKDNGRSQEAAALNEMRRSLDARIDGAAAGAGQPGDVMPQAAADAYREANRSYAALQDRFHTGPQAGLFRRGGDGLPAKQGGEIAQAFWGNRPGLAEDVQSFRRLVDDQPGLMGQFRSLITTHGAGTADAAGNLTTKFSKWVEQTLPGLKGAFSPADVESLQRIAQDIDRAAAAQKLGTSLGGSNTYQNAQNALSLGLLDSPAVGKAASLIPGVRMVAAPALEAGRGALRNAKAARLASMLSDSDTTANAIEQLIQLQNKQPNAITRLLMQTQPQRLAYRTAPILASDR